MDYGLLAGLGGMLTQGVDSYTKALAARTQRDSINELRDVERKRNQITMSEHGLEDDGSGGIRQSEIGRKRVEYTTAAKALDDEGKAWGQVPKEVLMGSPDLQSRHMDYMDRVRKFGQPQQPAQGMLGQPKGLLADPMDSKEGLLSEPEAPQAPQEEVPQAPGAQATGQEESEAFAALAGPQPGRGAASGVAGGFLGGDQRQPDAQGAAVQTPVGYGLPSGFKTMAERRLEEQKRYHDIMGGLRGDSVDEKKNVNAATAGQAFEKDPIITPLKKQQQALDRLKTILTGKNPVTSQQLNTAYMDYSSAVAQGGAATEGKVHLELIQPFAGKLNELESRFGKVSDIRAKVPELITNLLGAANQLKGDYDDAIDKQASMIHSSFKDSSNPKVQSTIKRKLKEYSPRAYSREYGEEPMGPKDVEDLSKQKTVPVAPSAHKPGDIVEVKGKGTFRVGADGDSLEPM